MWYTCISQLSAFMCIIHVHLMVIFRSLSGTKKKTLVSYWVFCSTRFNSRCPCRSCFEQKSLEDRVRPHPTPYVTPLNVLSPQVAVSSNEPKGPILCSAFFSHQTPCCFLTSLRLDLSQMSPTLDKAPVASSTASVFVCLSISGDHLK